MVDDVSEVRMDLNVYVQMEDYTLYHIIVGDYTNVQQELLYTTDGIGIGFNFCYEKSIKNRIIRR